MGADRGRGGGHTDRAQAGVRHAAYRGPADDRGHPDDGRGCRDQRCPQPRHGEDRPDGHHRVRRREQHDVGVRERVEHPRRRPRLLGPDRDDLLGRGGGAHPQPPLLEVHGPPPLLGVDDHMCLDPVVAHRQQTQPRLPPLAQRRGHVGERIAGGEHLGADEMGGEVAVAEPEPGRADAVGCQLFGHGERLLVPAPAPLGGDPPAEGVHDRVEVGADTQAVQGDVVTGVADHRDVGVG